uniref:Uncharacterized protein MANES_03G196000 n=1 Tax=Rhizophora mucronata TaxID=61149 RepID=A0A2P2KEW5_RHIMU
MGAITSNRKRDSYPYTNSPDFHASKKPRFSHLRQSSNRSPGSCNSTASRIARYPETTSKFRREVHAPCRIVKFGLSKLRSYDYSEKEMSSGGKMVNFLSKNLDSARRNAFGVIRFLFKEKDVIDVDIESQKLGKEILSDDSRYLVKGKEVIDLDEEPQKLGKEILSEDSSIEGVAVVEDGREWRSQDEILCSEEDNDVKIVEERSVVTVDGNFGLVEKAEKMMDSFALNREVDVTSVGAYKKLLEKAARRSSKLSDLNFEIELNEKKWSSLKLFERKPKEKPVEIPREPFLPLTKEEEAEVHHAFSACNRRKVLVSHKNSNIDITGEVLMCLTPCAWLNDEVINVYLELLKEREKREPQKFLKCHFCNTFFYKKLVSGKNTYDYKAVKRWTTERKLGYFLLDCDKIFIPVHREIHWCLAIINRKDQKFQYLDSLKGKDLRVLENLARYYVEEVKDKSRRDIDVSNWEREYVEDLPEQENGFDCGMFMIKYADFYSRGLGLCFSQVNK